MFTATETRITTLAAEWWRLVQAGNTPGLSDPEAEWYFDAADAIVARLAELPAADASEIAAKVLICACEYRLGEPLPGTDVYALMLSTLIDAARFAGPGLELLAENVICDTDAPDRPENQRRSASGGLH
jgi:hypothetical protein